MTAHQAHRVDVRHWYHAQTGKGFYTACDNWNLSFTPAELEVAIKGWREGEHIADIAQAVARPVREIGVLIMSLAEENRIGKRKHGAIGK